MSFLVLGLEGNALVTLGFGEGGEEPGRAIVSSKPLVSLLCAVLPVVEIRAYVSAVTRILTHVEPGDG